MELTRLTFDQPNSVMRQIELEKVEQRGVEKAERRCNELRSEYTKMAYKSYGINPDGVAEVAASLEIDLKAVQIADFDEELCPTFEELIQDAAQLDVDFRMCRARYKIFMCNEEETLLGDSGDWPRYGMKFDSEEYMEEIEETGVSVVALIVAPALVKEGNSSGRNYDKVCVVANRQVICS